MAWKYTIANNVLKEFEAYIIEQRVINKEPLKYRERLWIRLIEIKKKKEWEPKIEKKTYLKFVHLTEEEHKQLEETYWKDKVKTIIDRLNTYIWSHWDKYKSHYYTIINWFQKNGDKKIEIKDKIEIEQKIYKPMTDDEKIKAKELLLKARNILTNK